MYANLVIQFRLKGLVRRRGGNAAKRYLIRGLTTVACEDDGNNVLLLSTDTLLDLQSYIDMTSTEKFDTGHK